MTDRNVRGRARSWVVGQLHSSPTYWIYIRRRLPEDIWWSVRAPRVSRAYKRAFQVERDFYAAIFRDRRIQKIFDIGGNNGDKTEIFLAAGASSVVLVEPDPHWRQIHQWRYGRDRRVAICPAAVSDAPGVLALRRFSPGSPLNTIESKWVDALATGVGRFEPQAVEDVVNVRGTTFSQLVETFGAPDYAKVDVEGHEAAVLSGMTEWPRLLSLEFNLPEFSSEMAICMKAISDCGQGCLCNIVTDYAEGFVFPHWLPVGRLADRLESMELRYLELFVDSSGLRERVAVPGPNEAVQEDAVAPPRR